MTRDEERLSEELEDRREQLEALASSRPEEHLVELLRFLNGASRPDDLTLLAIRWSSDD